MTIKFTRYREPPPLHAPAERNVKLSKFNSHDKKLYPGLLQIIFTYFR